MIYYLVLIGTKRDSTTIEVRITMKNKKGKEINNTNNTFYTKLMKLIEHPLLCQNLCQGYPTTVFGELSVRGSKYCLEFSLLEEDVKILRSPFLSGIIFEAYLISSLRFSEVYTQTP